jgi:hypothetical protein
MVFRCTNRRLTAMQAGDSSYALQPKVRFGVPAGGRRSLTQTDPTVLEDLQRLLEPATVGNPMRR